MPELLAKCRYMHLLVPSKPSHITAYIYLYMSMYMCMCVSVCTRKWWCIHGIRYPVYKTNSLCYFVLTTCKCRMVRGKWGTCDTQRGYLWCHIFCWLTEIIISIISWISAISSCLPWCNDNIAWGYNALEQFLSDPMLASDVLLIKIIPLFNPCQSRRKSNTSPYGLIA